MQKIKIGIICFLVSCLIQKNYAQFDTQSPYSYYGVGNLVSNTLQNGFAMGGVSQALRDSAFVNPINPASLSSLDVTQLIFGFEGNFLTRTDNGVQYNNNNLFINQFGLGIPVMHKHKFVNWGMYLGYSPYSFVGYKLNDTGTVYIGPDTLLANYDYTGSGGLNRITWGNGFQLGRNFSIGFNLHYLFGISNRVRTLELPSASGYMSSRIDEKTRVNHISFDAGMQGYFNFKVKKFLAKKEKGDTTARKFINKNYGFVIGATYQYGGSFDAGFDQLGIQYLSGNVDFGVDTFLINPEGTGNITMPHGFGGGIALINPGIWNLNVDFNYKFWQDFKYFDQPDLVYYNSFSVHGGFEYIPKFDNKYDKRRFFKNIVYRLGARYYNRFYRPDTNPVDEVGISFGVGLPFGFSRVFDEELNRKITISYINLGFEAGVANSRTSGLINETFVRFAIGVTLRDKWFTKRYYN